MFIYSRSTKYTHETRAILEATCPQWHSSLSLNRMIILRSFLQLMPVGTILTTIMSSTSLNLPSLCPLAMFSNVFSIESSDFSCDTIVLRSNQFLIEFPSNFQVKIVSYNSVSCVVFGSIVWEKLYALYMYIIILNF